LFVVSYTYANNASPNPVASILPQFLIPTLVSGVQFAPESVETVMYPLSFVTATSCPLADAVIDVKLVNPAFVIVDQELPELFETYTVVGEHAKIRGPSAEHTISLQSGFTEYDTVHDAPELFDVYMKSLHAAKKIPS
jgi:hypothetical protein